jgi:hypothetical protein
MDCKWGSRLVAGAMGAAVTDFFSIFSNTISIVLYSLPAIYDSIEYLMGINQIGENPGRKHIDPDLFARILENHNE